MKETKTSRIKTALLNGQALTSMEAFGSNFKYVTRLSAIIHRLRHKLGLPIVTATPDMAYADGVITDYERKAMMVSFDSSHFAVYYIKPADLEAIKNAG